MANILIINIGAILTILWGISHLFPTKNVVKEFGDISEDNKRIITMEWINEGVSLIFIGVVVVITSLIDNSDSIVASFIYWVSSTMLLVLAVISLFTGARIDFLPFKLCPVIFTASATLIIIGSIL